MPRFLLVAALMGFVVIGAVVGGIEGGKNLRQGTRAAAAAMATVRADSEEAKG